MSENTDLTVVENVHETASTIEEQAAALKEFREDIETKASQVDRMGEREQTAFYGNAESLSRELETIETVEELLALDDRIEDLVRSPLREAAIAELDSFLELVDPTLSSGTEENVRHKVGDSIPQDLEAITESYQELSSKLEQLPPFLTDRVRAAIEDRPTSLTDPGGELRELIEQLQTRQDSLQQIDEALSTAGAWAPEGTLAKDARLYQDLGATLPTGQAKKQFQQIEEKITEIEANGLDVTELVNTELNRGLEETGPASLLDPFSSINGELYSLQSTYETVAEWVADLEAFGSDRGLYEEEIDEILTTNQRLQIQQFDSVDVLRKRAQSLDDDIKSFIETCAEELKVKQQMVEDVMAVLDDASPPETEFNPDGTGRVTPQSVRTDLQGALTAILELDEWFTDAFAKLGDSFDTDGVFELWKQLYEGDSVQLTEENQATVLALAEQFSIRVVLGSE